MSHWFPRPSRLEDIVLSEVGANPASQAFLFQLLTSEFAEEWRDKVGVAGGREGAASPDTRLLRAHDWVCKSHNHLKQNDFEVVRAYINQHATLEKQIPIWHPEKTWALVFCDDVWWPISATPLVFTLRRPLHFGAWYDYWLQALFMLRETWRDFGKFLDFNPSNFGYRFDKQDRLYYIDDELYDTQQPSTLGRVFIQLLLSIEEEHAYAIEEFALDAGVILQQIFVGNAWDTFMDQIQWYEGPQPQRIRAFHQGLLKLLLDKKATKQLLSPEEKQSHVKDTDETVSAQQHDPEESDTLITCEKVSLAHANGTNHGQVTPGHQEESEHVLLGPDTDPATWCVVLTDVHANDLALTEVLEDAQQFPVSSYLCLGDIVGYGPCPKATLNRIRALPNLTCIQGNHDYMVATADFTKSSTSPRTKASSLWTREQLSQEELDWLADLPLSLPLYGKGLAVHGSLLGTDYRFPYIYEMTYRENLDKAEELGLHFLFYGHSHLAMVYRKNSKGQHHKLGSHSIRLFQDSDIFLINPGSVGQPRDGDRRAAYLLFNPSTGEIIFRRVVYDVEQASALVQAEESLSTFAIRLLHGN